MKEETQVSFELLKAIAVGPQSFVFAESPSSWGISVRVTYNIYGKVLHPRTEIRARAKATRRLRRLAVRTWGLLDTKYCYHFTREEWRETLLHIIAMTDYIILRLLYFVN